MRIAVRRQSIATAVAVLCAFAPLAPTQVAHAAPEAQAPPGGGGMSPSLYPSVAAVARLFPEYRGGERVLLGQRQLSVTSPDCQYLDVAATQPRKGRTAVYFARDGQTPFLTGGTHVSVGLYDFRLPRRAQAALDEQRDTITGCLGSNIDADGHGVTYRGLEAPGVGDDRFAFRSISHDANVGRDWFVTVYFRQGRFLGEARLQRDRNAPAPTAAFALARTAVRAAS